MKKHIQRFLHDPDNGIYGDCHRTALACMLDLEPEDVPHFGHHSMTEENYDWRIHEREFLKELGYGVAYVPFTGRLIDIFITMESFNPESYYMLGGTSNRGLPHTVICKAGKFFHDPHPSQDFVCNPLETGCYEISFITPLIT